MKKKLRTVNEASMKTVTCASKRFLLRGISPWVIRPHQSLYRGTRAASPYFSVGQWRPGWLVGKHITSRAYPAANGYEQRLPLRLWQTQMLMSYEPHAGNCLGSSDRQTHLQNPGELSESIKTKDFVTINAEEYF